MNKFSVDSNNLHNNNGSKNGMLNGHFEHQSGNVHKIPQNNISVRWVLGQLWHYKWALLFFLFIFTFIAAFIARNIQPVYKSKGTLIINASKNRYSYAGSDISNLLTTSYGLGAGSTFANQLAILRSRKIAGEVADRVMQHPIMSSGKEYPVLWNDYPEDSARISRERLIGHIRSKLHAQKSEGDADLVDVTFESNSSQEASQMVNLVMDTYAEVSTDQNRQAAHSAGEFLKDQRQKVKSQLQSSEEKLKNFQENTGFVAAESQTSGDFEKLSQLQQKKQEERIKLFSVNSVIQNYNKELEKLRPDFSENFAENVGPMLAKLQDKLADLEAKRIVLLSKNPQLENKPEGEPQLVQLNNQIGALKSKIRNKANAILADNGASAHFVSGVQGTERLADLRKNLVQARINKAEAEAQIKVINQLLTNEEQKMDEVPKEILTLNRLKRDLSMKEALYKTISQQYAETSLWEQTQSGAGTPLDYATVPGAPVEPNLFLYLVGGLFLGSVAGVGYIFYRVETNTRIESPGQLSALPFPLLSVIPDFKKDHAYREDAKSSENGQAIHKDWITLYESNSSAAEAFRKLQNNILYSRPDQPLKTLMITSSEQGEGKTSVAINLATTLTEAGKRVLVIDSDLRRPNLYKLTRVDKMPGLMDVIFEDKSLDESIQPTVHDHVFVLSQGTRPPNPPAVLRSEKMAVIVDEIKTKFDYILFDTPPLGVIGDAAPLIRFIDGVIVVAKFEDSRIGPLQKLIDDLQHLHAPVLGTVLVGFDPRKSTYGYYQNYDYYDSFYAYKKYVEDA